MGSEPRSRARWLDDNQDLAALVVDVQMQGGEWPSSLKHFRSLPNRPAVVVVVPEGTEPKFESLGPPADGYLTKGQTFLGDLPIAVTRAVTRVRGSHSPPPAPSDVRASAAHRGRPGKVSRPVAIEEGLPKGVRCRTGERLKSGRPARRHDGYQVGSRTPSGRRRKFIPPT